MLSLVLAGACTATPSGPNPSPDSVRERLEDETHLQVTATESGGTLTAERRISGGWDTGLVALAIANGELVLSSDAQSALTLESLLVTFDPIALPDGLFSTSAQLTDVRVELAQPMRGAAAWKGDNEVHFTASIPLSLHWTLRLDDSPTPLGSPELPPVPVELVLTGNGDHVDADLQVRAPGEVWSWAGLIKFSKLELSLGASLK